MIGNICVALRINKHFHKNHNLYLHTAKWPYLIFFLINYLFKMIYSFQNDYPLSLGKSLFCLKENQTLDKEK